MTDTQPVRNDRGQPITDEVTVNLAVRVKAGFTTDLVLQQALLAYIHGFPGYVAAATRIVRRDAAGTPHPYPLDTSQETER